MNIGKIIKLLTAKDSPFKKIMGLNKAGTTRGDAVAVAMTFVQQEFITKLLDGLHRYYQAELGKLPAGHLIELRLLPDMERRQLKVLVEDVSYNAVGNEVRKPIYTLYTRDFTDMAVQDLLIKLLGGADAMQQPFVLEDFVSSFKKIA